MPTILLLDASLSMARPISSSGEIAVNDIPTRRALAEVGLSMLLDFISTNTKLEFVCLIIFSSLWEIVVPFTRDFSEVKKALCSVELFDRTNLLQALEGIKHAVMEEWGGSTECQIILVTDGSPGIGPGPLKHIVQNLSSLKADEPSAFPMPYEFPNTFHVVLLSSQTELQNQGSVSMWQKLIEANKQQGQIHTTEGPLTLESTKNMFAKLSEDQYSAFRATLACGHQTSEVQLFPPPKTVSAVNDFEVLTRDVSSRLNVCGFLHSADVSSPPVISRHLVLPLGSKDKGLPGVKSASQDGNGDKESQTDAGSVPSFCVLLHGSLKIESLVALVNVGDNWFGLLHSFAESKKKSSLMLSLFEPGNGAIPWLGKFNLLGPCSAFATNPYGEGSEASPFPVRLQEKRSYSQNPVTWIKPSAMQADIQKIVRYARRLPDKTQVFYKELNRLRRAALALGMTTLMKGMAEMLERECTALHWSTHPDAALQLTHAAKMLEAAMHSDYEQNILPLSTNFAQES